MNIIDTHCDALYKLQEAKWEDRNINFRDASELETNLARLQKGKVKVQFFAIFLEPDITSDRIWYAALEQIELFQTEIIEKNPLMKHITAWKDIEKLQQDEIGAVLTLEGADCIGNDIDKLHYLYEQGILSVGLTWNNANLCADGAGEPRGAGLTTFGKEVVKLNNEFDIFTDVSHLSIKAFWDVMELADYPFASHSNARTICDHPRNLNDDQLKAMIDRNAPIHLVFNPPFLKQDSSTASLDDIIKHIKHITELGGFEQLGFGSDFDGIEEHVTDLEHAGKYPLFIEKLLKSFSPEEVQKLAYTNFLNKILK